MTTSITLHPTSNLSVFQPNVCHQKQTTLVLFVVLCVNAIAVPVEKDYAYTGIDGQEHAIKAFFPGGLQPGSQLPCYIYFHGGGWKSGDLNQGKPLCEYLASRGIVAVSANYSMHRKSDKGESNQGIPLASGESRKRICVIDAKSVVRWVKQNAAELAIHPGKLIVSGASAGAHLSVLQMMDERFNNPADPEGVDTDVQAFVLLAAAFTMLDQDPTPEVNVFQYIDKPFPPTLFMVGETDRWATTARVVAEKLHENSDNEIEFWIAPQMGHMFMRQGDWYTPTKLLIDRFLRDHGFLSGAPTLKPLEGQPNLQQVDLN